MNEKPIIVALLGTVVFLSVILWSFMFYTIADMREELIEYRAVSNQIIPMNHDVGIIYKRLGDLEKKKCNQQE